MADRYPRTCRGRLGPHVIAGPDDEVIAFNRAGRRVLTCAVCKRAGRRRTQARRVASGKHAETRARSARRAADTGDVAGRLLRIPRAGVETKTRNGDT